MPLIQKIRKIVLTHFMELRWHSILLIVALYILVSWGLLWLCDEHALIAGNNFIYWIMVTASTVGYGDMSPETTLGKYTVSLFIIPFGLGLFGLAIGRLAAFFSFHWRKGVQGLKTLNFENHILIVGWNEGRTLQLIRLLLREIKYSTEQPKIALCVKSNIDNPLPDVIGFVKVGSFSCDEDMTRAAIQKASCIIIDNQDDDVTMTTALYCSSRNPKAHTIAYFKDDSLGALLKTHCPNVECMPSVAVEMIAKSAMDPGSSALHHQLLDVDSGMTQYSVKYAGTKPMLLKGVFSAFKEQYDATLIGVSLLGHGSIELNPPLDLLITPESTLYYIADERINRIEWGAFDV